MKNHPGRPNGKKKDAPYLLKLNRELGSFVRKQSSKTGKTRLRIIEELIEYRMQFKVWPPV